MTERPLAERVCEALAPFAAWQDGLCHPLGKSRPMTIIPRDPEDDCERVEIDSGLDGRYRVWLNGTEVTRRTMTAVVSRVPGVEIDGWAELLGDPPRVDERGRVIIQWVAGQVRWEPLLEGGSLVEAALGLEGE